MNTLDILEDCLDQIHKSRQASLTSRSRRFNLRQEKRKAVLKPKSRTPISSITFDADGNDDVDFMDRLVMDTNVDTTEESSGQIQTKSLKNSKSSPQPILQGKAFTTYAEHQKDEKASAVFEEFAVELTNWWNESAIRRKSVENRGEFADFLTDRYMCQKLDPLPPTAVVSKIRKDISAIIEEFASSPSLPTNFPETVFGVSQAGLLPSAGVEAASRETAAVKGATTAAVSQDIAATKTKVGSLRQAPPPPSTSVNSSTASKGNNAAAPVPSQRPVESAAAVAARKAAKEEAEKAAVKQQYEAFMKSKRVATPKGDEVTRQYEELNEDIKSLIQSLQSRPK